MMYIRDNTVRGASSLAGIGDGLGQVRLRLGIAIARLQQIQQLQRDAARNPSRDPNQREKGQIRAETGVNVDANPYFGLTQQHLEAVLRASEESAGPVRQSPEVLLALWSKEGSLRTRFGGVRIPGDIAHLLNGGSVTTANNARVLARSFIFWTDMGTDHFSYSPPGAPDNRPLLNDATVPNHDRVFTTAIQQLVNQGFLERNIAAEITNQLTVIRSAGAGFIVTPSLDFYVGTLKLAGALFSSLQAQTFALLGGDRPSVGLNYLQWNMGSVRFNQFLQSADIHRRAAGIPTIEQWALHTQPRAGQWPQPRTNAIKFAFLVNAYAKLFPPLGDFPTPSGSVRFA